MTVRPPISQFIGLLVWLMIVFAAAAVGAIAAVDASGFYAELSKPSWAPPSWLFGPVWSALYTLMGVSAWLVWRTARSSRSALTLFIAQLIANALWSWLFFAWHQGALAAVEIVVLLVLIILTTRAFSRISRPSAALLLPYLLWVSFATALTFAVWLGNPSLL